MNNKNKQKFKNIKTTFQKPQMILLIFSHLFLGKGVWTNQQICKINNCKKFSYQQNNATQAF